MTDTIDRLSPKTSEHTSDQAYVNVAPTIQRVYTRWPDATWHSEYVIEYGSGRFTARVDADRALSAALDAKLADADARGLRIPRLDDERRAYDDAEQMRAERLAGVE
jgi:hypothetical protein